MNCSKPAGENVEDYSDNQYVSSDDEDSDSDSYEYFYLKRIDIPMSFARMMYDLDSNGKLSQDMRHYITDVVSPDVYTILNEILKIN